MALTPPGFLDESMHLTVWRKNLGRQFDFAAVVMTRCGVEVGRQRATGWHSDVDCDACLTGPYLGAESPPTHGRREKDWFR